MSKLEQLEVAMTQRQKEVCAFIRVSLQMCSTLSSLGGDDGRHGEGEEVTSVFQSVWYVVS